MALLSKFVKFSHLFADVIANVEFAFRGDHLVVLLVLQRFLANGVVADDLAALCFVLFDLGESYDGRTVRTLDSERVNDLFDDTRCASDFDIQMTHRAVFVHNQPVLNAQLAIKFVAVVALLCISAHFYQNNIDCGLCMK